MILRSRMKLMKISFIRILVDAFSPNESGEIVFPWPLILTFVGLKFLQGGGTGGQGILNNIRTFLWIRVQQYTTREIQVSLAGKGLIVKLP